VRITVTDNFYNAVIRTGYDDKSPGTGTILILHCHFKNVKQTHYRMVYAGNTFRTYLLSQFIHKSYTNTVLLQREDNVISTFKTMAHVKHTEGKTIKKHHIYVPNRLLRKTCSFLPTSGF
jgi:hypothetical protein